MWDVIWVLCLSESLHVGKFTCDAEDSGKIRTVWACGIQRHLPVAWDVGLGKSNPHVSPPFLSPAEDEMFSDIYKITEVANGLCLEVEGKVGCDGYTGV